MTKKERTVSIVTVLALLLGCFGWLDVMPMRGEEQRRALVALEMYLSGDYLHPSLLGWPYYNKPPLFHWAIAAGYALFDDFSNRIVRLPGVLAFFATGAIHYLVVRRWVGSRVALFSALFYLTTGTLLYFATVISGDIDLFYSLLVYLQAIVIFWGFQERRFLPMFVLSYFFMALGFLTKGMPSILFQGLTLLGAMAWFRAWAPLISGAHLLGLVAGLAPLAWYFLAYDAGGEALTFLGTLLREALQKSAAANTHWTDYLYVLTFPFQRAWELMPWVLGLGLLFTGKGRASLQRNPLVGFAVVFILANIWVYWSSSEVRGRYLYMFYPFFSLLSAWALQRLSRVKTMHVLLLALALAVGRIVYNVALLPAQVRNLERSEMMDSVAERAMEMAGDQPIYFCGPLETVDVPRFFLSQAFRERAESSPVEMPYYIAFAVARKRREPVRYQTTPEPGGYYFAEEDYIQPHAPKVLFRFDSPGNAPMVFCRMPD